MTIQDLAPGEVDAAVRLWEVAGLTRPWNDAWADAHRALAGPSSTVLAGQLEGRLVATAMVGHEGHRGWVYYLAVEPGLHGRGHGRELMRTCEDWLRQRGVPKIQLMLRGDNRQARAFYDRLGYAVQDVVVLGRRLDLVDGDRPAGR